MQALNNHSIIKLVDNRTHKAFVQDRTVYQPVNKGIVAETNGVYSKGTELYFYEHGLSKVDNYYALDNKNVFMVDGLLVVPGVIVRKVSHEQHLGFTTAGSQEWFEVVMSELPGIEPVDIVIIRTNMSQKFIYSGQELFFLQPHSIMLIVDNNNEIKPGPAYELIQQVNDTPSFFKYTVAGKNKGLLRGHMVYFKHKVFTVDIAGESFHVVPRDEIYGIDGNYA